MNVTFGRLAVASALVSALTMLTNPANAQKRDAKPATPSSSTTSADPSTAATATSPTTPAKPADPVTPPNDETKDERKKHGLLFNAEFGVGRTSLAGFSDSLSFDKFAANGLMYGVGAGVRLGDVRLGARFRSQSTTEFTMWSLLAEAGYGIKLEPLEPIFLFHVGYSWNQQLERATISSSLPPGNLLKPEVDLHTLVLGAEVNALYSINQAVKVGPFIGFDFLIVKRDQVDLPQSIFAGQTTSGYTNLPLYNEDGHSVGYNLNLGIRGVLDFGF